MKRLLLILIFLFTIQVFGQTASVGVDTFSGSFSKESNAVSGKLSLWYRRPAKVWTW